MYVVAHKKYESPIRDDNMYIPILVGKNSNQLKLEFDKCVVDNMGDSISDRNGRYNELTALYWIWKNSDAEIVGLCHYRRYFVKLGGKLANVFMGKKCGFIDGGYIAGKMKKYDIIVHNKTYFKRKSLEQLSDQSSVTYVSIEIMQLAERVFENVYPEDLYIYRKIINGKTAHLLNMFVARKEVVDRYCKWLFGYLFVLEEAIDRMFPNENLPRVMGLIAERLLDVWLVKERIRVKECFSINTEKRNITNWA